MDERADEEATAEAAQGDRKVMLDAIRALSNILVDGSADPHALERPLPRPDLADPFDWKGYAP